MKVRNKKQNQAIALLDNERSSPSMIAKDSNELAERIIAIAKQNDIPIKEEPGLVKLLSEVAPVTKSLNFFMLQFLTFCHSPIC
jgi:flagellar biosynthesis protein